MCEVHSLEGEKDALAKELEKAQVDPTKGCSRAIKTKLQKVEASLARARSETRKHQQLYRKAEAEAQKCKVLERKIHDLKHAKVNLVKKQREVAAKHKEFTNQKTREINALKRKEKTADKKISKMGTVSIHVNISWSLRALLTCISSHLIYLRSVNSTRRTGKGVGLTVRSCPISSSRQRVS